MKKILIHTLFYKNYNYGGMLQAYALYHKLSELGFDCEELNYSREIYNPKKKLLYKFKRIFEILCEPKSYIDEKNKNIIRDSNRRIYIEKTGDPLKNVFEEFMNEEFRTTKVVHPDTIDGLEGYDYYVAGGDQVWNPEWTDGNFFFSTVKGGKKIAYSCSAGKSSFTKRDQKKLADLAKKMDVISVREKNLSDLLREGGLDNVEVADPVFLYNKEEWMGFSRRVENLPEHYVFAYILGDDAERRGNIRKFAEKNNLKIVSIPHVFRYYIDEDETFADYSIKNAGPREFVYLINNADFIMTDSFHGTAFSLIFEKQFLNFSRFADNDKKSLNARLSNILEEYGLNNRMIKIDEITGIDIKDLPAINYIECNVITSEKREQAIRFLNDNLKEG